MILRKYILLFIICSLFLVGCTPQENTIQEITDTDLGSITKIVFVHSTSGESIVTEDRLKIWEFTGYLEDFVLQESSDQQERTEDRWAAEFYENGEKAFQITFAKPLEINGTEYEILEPQLDIEAVERFIDKLPEND
ncbi:hypothetical protein [Dethiobacter alkaliphilus]|uniref:Lipoprotein n=1 Tax=Dethiobacter alkaliphilus AHT 1 TaxID=555088 RepID=C0GF75_DETAL|nr:hypothetical protein [Dethiobacter alkaliphilus]EEG77835.1 hypothetical protein DealDRAFT_1134 [Dethiobacter alkaliphilus AHT 1]